MGESMSTMIRVKIIEKMQENLKFVKRPLLTEKQMLALMSTDSDRLLELFEGSFLIKISGLTDETILDMMQKTRGISRESQPKQGE